MALPRAASDLHDNTPPFSSLEVMHAEQRAATLRLAARTPPPEATPPVTSASGSSPTRYHLRSRTTEVFLRRASRMFVVGLLAFFVLAPIVRYLASGVQAAFATETSTTSTTPATKNTVVSTANGS